MKIISLKKIPSKELLFKKCSRGHWCEKLSDKELVESMLYNRFANDMFNKPEISYRVSYPLRWQETNMSVLGSDILYDRMSVEFYKRGLYDKYDIQVNLLDLVNKKYP